MVDYFLKPNYWNIYTTGMNVGAGLPKALASVN
jgi:hypothetical protein